MSTLTNLFRMKQRCPSCKQRSDPREGKGDWSPVGSRLLYCKRCKRHTVTGFLCDDPLSFEAEEQLKAKQNEFLAQVILSRFANIPIGARTDLAYDLFSSKVINPVAKYYALKICETLPEVAVHFEGKNLSILIRSCFCAVIDGYILGRIGLGRKVDEVPMSKLSPEEKGVVFEKIVKRFDALTDSLIPHELQLCAETMAEGEVQREFFKTSPKQSELVLLLMLVYLKGMKWAMAEGGIIE